MATTKITNPDLFDLGSLNTALKLPSGTTAERPTSPSTGEWRYNTTTNLVEYYDGGSWRELVSEDIPPVPSENFNTVIYTGNGSTQSITGVGFQPDWIWIKERTSTSNNVTFDSTRGIYEQLYITTDAESNNTATVSSFDSDGFSLGNGLAVNENGQDYVAWCWKANGGTTSSNGDGSVTSTVQANTGAGFSVITWAGTGGVNTVGHGLNSAPELILIKGLSSVGDWQVYSSVSGNGNKLVLNSTAAQSSTTRFDSTSPTSSVFTLNDSGLGTNLVAYAFHSVSQYSKIGSYTGNGSSNGPIVNTGFEPAFIMIKNSTAIYEWVVYDNKRSTSNPRDNVLYPNTNGTENSGETGDINFFSNGFQIKDAAGSINQNGGTILYAAFASTPSTAPVLADSFTTATYNGTGTTNSLTGFGLRPDLAWFKCRNVATGSVWHDTVRGPISRIFSYSSSAESNVFDGFVSFDSDGVTLDGTGSGGDVNASGRTYVVWNWKANPMPTINNDGDVQSVVSANQAAGFSIINFTTPSTNNFSVGHGLGAAPDLVIYKCLSQTSNWTVYDSISGAEKYLLLDGAGAQQDDSLPFNDTEPTSTVLNLGSATVWWATNANYIAYAIKSISGFSKVGTYTGNGSTQSITGVGFQPSWLMIKQINGSNSWRMFDSARGLSSPQTLFANLVSAEDSESNTVSSFDSDGWTMGSQQGVNDNGDTYLYWAIKENVTTSIPAGEAEFLVVAGGGGAGGGCYARGGGGAGAGGLRTSIGSTSGGGSSAESNITLASGTYTITIGTGGSTGSSCTAGGTGNDSSITGLVTITSDGGGYSGSGTLGAGGAGGSGGSGYDGGGAATANQGYPGIRSLFNSTYWAGGGGGAASQGNTVQNNGAGGAGLEVNGTFYAGGGGTGQSSGYGSGNGGTGGGGDGQNLNFYTTQCDGDVNTGGGGGGGTYTTSGVPGTTRGGQGGSGVVILQMNASDYSGNTTGSPTVSSAGGVVTLTYTGSGTYVHS